jgi:penicillin-binding protein 1B
VYLTALNPDTSDNPISLASLLSDEPLALKTPQGTYKPQNYDKSFHGLVRARTALENSYNVAAVWLGQQASMKNVTTVAKSLGLTNTKPFASTALGAIEVMPLDLARAYTVFPNLGRLSQVIAIRRVLTKDGELLQKKSIALKEVADARSTFLVTQALQGVLADGTARSASEFSNVAAGKTGTTSDYRDSWFAGYTNDLLAVSWVGYPDNAPTGLSGATGALPIWKTFMQAAGARVFSSKFDVPPGIITLAIDSQSGLAYDSSCQGTSVQEYFDVRVFPQKTCSGREVNLDLSKTR